MRGQQTRTRNWERGIRAAYENPRMRTSGRLGMFEQAHQRRVHGHTRASLSTGQSRIQKATPPPALKLESARVSREGSVCPGCHKLSKSRMRRQTNAARPRNKRRRNLREGSAPLLCQGLLGELLLARATFGSSVGGPSSTCVGHKGLCRRRLQLPLSPAVSGL